MLGKFRCLCHYRGSAFAATRSASISGQRTVLLKHSLEHTGSCMQKNAPYLATCLLGLTIAALPGCASFSGTSEQPAPDTQTASRAEAAPDNIQYADFEPEVLYQLLSAEIAAQRGRYDVTLVNYLQAAKTSRSEERRVGKDGTCRR